MTPRRIRTPLLRTTRLLQSCCLLLLAVWLLPPPLHAQINGIENAHLVSVVNLEGAVYHVQGVDLDAEHIWVTSVDSEGQRAWLHQFSRATAKLERQVDLTDGPRYHPGGFSVHGDSIWVPVAEYRPHSSAVIEEFDRHTLVLKQKILVPDHLGCLAVTPDGLLAGNWDSKELYVLDMSGKQIRVIENPTNNNYQDMKFDHGMLVASGTITRTTGAVDWFAWPSMKLVRRLRSGATDRGKAYTAEAMAVVGNDLYFVPEDVHARLFHFAISAQ
jgi:hypothetical protein